jgi:hypothetical protein
MVMEMEARERQATGTLSRQPQGTTLTMQTNTQRWSPCKKTCSSWARSIIQVSMATVQSMLRTNQITSSQLSKSNHLPLRWELLTTLKKSSLRRTNSTPALNSNRILKDPSPRVTIDSNRKHRLQRIITLRSQELVLPKTWATNRTWMRLSSK